LDPGQSSHFDSRDALPENEVRSCDRRSGGAQRPVLRNKKPKKEECLQRSQNPLVIIKLFIGIVIYNAPKYAHS
jgi:hypothetical protein